MNPLFRTKKGSSIALGCRLGRTRSNLFSKFCRETSGNFAILFALSVIPLLLVSSYSIEVSRAISNKSMLQHAMDTAVLASFDLSGTFNEARAKSIFEINSGNSSVASPSFEFAAGVVTGKVRMKPSSALLPVYGVEAIEVNVKAKARSIDVMKVSKASFQPISAKGTYDKDFYFFTRDASGQIMTRQLILNYDYTNNNGRQSAVLTPNNWSSSTVDVGDYASFGYEMVVFEDKTYTGKRKNKEAKSYFSDDKNASQFARVIGDCSKLGGSLHQWEDGGNADFLDFQFRMTCVESEVKTGNLRLVE